MSAARSSLDDALAEAVIAVEAGYLRKTTLACVARALLALGGKKDSQTKIIEREIDR